MTELSPPPCGSVVILALHDACCLQTILFTTDEDILESVADNDQTFEVDAQMDEPCSAEDMCNRPSTADGRDDVTMQ